MKTRPQIQVVAEKIVLSNPSLQSNPSLRAVLYSPIHLYGIAVYGVAVEGLLARATFDMSGNLENWYISG